MKCLVAFLLILAMISQSECSDFTTMEKHFVLFVKNVVERYFIDDHELVVALPERVEDSDTNTTPTHTNHSMERDQLTGTILEMLNNIIPIVTVGYVPRDVRKTVKVHKESGCIVLFWPQNIEYINVADMLIKIHSTILYASMTSQARILLVVMRDLLDFRFDFLEKLEIFGVYMSFYNLVTALPNSELHQISLSTWYPFNDPGQCGSFLQSVYLDSWITSNGGEFLYGKDLFPNKIPLTFGGCEIRVGTLRGSLVASSTIISMLEESIMSLLFKALDLSPVPKLALKDRDIYYDAFPVTFLNIDMLSDDVIMAYPHISSEVKWFHSCNRPVSAQGNIIKVFPWSVWFIIALILFLAVALAYFVFRSVETRGESSVFNSIASCFMCFWSVLLGVSVSDMPRTDRMRAYFIYWVWYCFVVSTVFQAFFTSFMVEPGHGKQIITLEDMISSKNLRGLSSGLLYTWCMNSPENYVACKNIKVICKDDSPQCFKSALNDRNYFVLFYDLEIDIYELLGVLNRDDLCSVVDSTYVEYFHVWFQNLNYFHETFNRILHRFLQAGLTEKLKDSVLQKLKHSDITELNRSNSSEDISGVTPSSGVKQSGSNNEDEFFVYSISHMKAAFYILLSGYILSVIVFMYEKLRGRLI